MAERKTARKATAAKQGTKAKGQKQSAAQRKRQAEERRLAEQLDGAKDGLKDPKGAAKTVETAEVYLAIWHDWASGMTAATCAERHNLGVRRVEQIVSEMRGARLNSLRLQDPLGTAQDLLLRWSHAVSQYAEMAESTTNDAVKLGAWRRRDEALEKMTQLMQELGHLPKHLGTLRIVEDWNALIDALLDKMEELGIPTDVQRQLVESVEAKDDDTYDGTAVEVASAAA